MTVIYDMVSNSFVEEEVAVNPELAQRSPRYDYPELQLQLVEHSVTEKDSISLPADMAYQTFISMPE